LFSVQMLEPLEAPLERERRPAAQPEVKQRRQQEEQQQQQLRRTNSANF
jgi:hypothetical protein